MSQVVPTGAVAYDIGANYGIHTLLLARLVSSTGIVFAFEPVPEIASELEHNVQLNGLTNVRCERKAVGAESGMLQFIRGHHAGAGHLESVQHPPTASFEVEVVSLDDFVFGKGNPPPNFIKMDIEGAEGDAMEGATKTISTYRPIVLVDLHDPSQDRRVGEVLATAGYWARRTDESKSLDLRSPWPATGGIWGQIIAYPDQTEN